MECGASVSVQFLTTGVLKGNRAMGLLWSELKYIMDIGHPFHWLSPLQWFVLCVNIRMMISVMISVSVGSKFVSGASLIKLSSQTTQTKTDNFCSRFIHAFAGGHRTDNTMERMEIINLILFIFSSIWPQLSLLPLAHSTDTVCALRAASWCWK